VQLVNDNGPFSLGQVMAAAANLKFVLGQ
jgi:hypothetical protein